MNYNQEDLGNHTIAAAIKRKMRELKSKWWREKQKEQQNRRQSRLLHTHTHTHTKHQG